MAAPFYHEQLALRKLLHQDGWRQHASARLPSLGLSVAAKLSSNAQVCQWPEARAHPKARLPPMRLTQTAGNVYTRKQQIQPPDRDGVQQHRASRSNLGSSLVPLENAECSREDPTQLCPHIPLHGFATSMLGPGYIPEEDSPRYDSATSTVGRNAGRWAGKDTESALQLSTLHPSKAGSHDSESFDSWFLPRRANNLPGVPWNLSCTRF
mmetsp:Transcript_41111/g.68328  ORF Transcript_41111/g.68328 Transcript_41111/m.68328 type:complete len:210 (-) Transcript_41111:98-727(-)